MSNIIQFTPSTVLGHGTASGDQQFFRDSKTYIYWMKLYTWFCCVLCCYCHIISSLWSMTLTHWPMGDFYGISSNVQANWWLKYILLNCSQVILTGVLSDDESTLVQVMAWCHQATSHYLNQCWPSSMLPYEVTEPQWDNLPIFFLIVSLAMGWSYNWPSIEV